MGVVAVTFCGTSFASLQLMWHSYWTTSFKDVYGGPGGGVNFGLRLVPLYSDYSQCDLMQF
jgi:hypothetical protein